MKLGDPEGSCHGVGHALTNSTGSQRLNTLPELVLVIGSINSSRHSKWWTSSRVHPWAPVSSKRRQGWSTGPKFPSSRWLAHSTGLRWKPALQQHSSDQDQKPCGQRVGEGPRGFKCSQTPNNFVGFLSLCLFASAAFVAWKILSSPWNMTEKKQKWRVKSNCPLTSDTLYLFISPCDIGMKDTFFGRVPLGILTERSESHPLLLCQVSLQKVWPKTLNTFLTFLYVTRTIYVVNVLLLIAISKVLTTGRRRIRQRHLLWTSLYHNVYKWINKPV